MPTRKAAKPPALSVELTSIHNYSNHVWTFQGLQQAADLVLQARQSGGVVKGQIQTVKNGMVTVQATPAGMVTP